MTDKILRMTKMSAFLMLLTLVIMACTPTATLPAPTEVAVEDAVAQTIEARDALALQVEQTVAAQMAALQPITEVPAGAEVPAGGDVADPNANIPVSQPVVDPNLAGGTPQLRVTAGSVNVRSGPGVNYPAFTTLRQDAVVVIVAKNPAGTWFLIELPGGARGWISNTVTTPVAEADMVKVVIAVTIPAPPAAAVPTTAAAATTAPTTAAAAPTKAAAAPATAVAATAVATTAATATTPPTPIPPTPTATVETPTSPEPTQLTKTNWQVDFLYPGGSHRLLVEFSQNGGVLSGSNRDNNAEVDIVTTGTVTADTVVVTFTLSNGGSPRGSVTCMGTIAAGPPQTISGSFTAPTNEAVGGTDGSCTFR